MNSYEVHIEYDKKESEQIFLELFESDEAIRMADELFDKGFRICVRTDIKGII